MNVMDEVAAARAGMVRRLKDSGILVSASVEEALRSVPRELFSPHVTARDAYADEALLVKRAEDGQVISSISDPLIVTAMLEMLSVEPGMCVLEIGTGTGYNAALLNRLVGRKGSVVSVELEPDLARDAVSVLGRLGVCGVDVLTGDGWAGCPARAPFDRIIVTAGALSIAPAWRDQLIEGGRLVVPLVNRQGRGFIVGLEKVGGRLRRGSTPEIPCGFVPLRHAPA